MVKSLFSNQTEDSHGDGLVATLRRSTRGALILLQVDTLLRLRAALGDEAAAVLCDELHQRLRACCRGKDTVLRREHGQFVVVAPHLTTLRAAQGLCRRLLAAAESLELAGRPVLITMSAGACFFPADGQTAAELTRRAEVSLLAAATQGCHVRFYEAELETTGLNDALLGGALRDALRDRELTLVYQPKHDVNSGALVGVEALMRWNSPQLGPVSPGRFIPIAERTGVIAQLTDFAIEKAAALAKRWDANALPSFRISVNVSAAELRVDGRRRAILALLRKLSAPMRRLQIEITESALVTERTKVGAMVRELREAGAQVAIDDFGTGYSSLAYLTTFQVDDLKIDRAFLHDLGQPHVQTLLRAVVDLGHALGMRIVVEGVEQQAQLDIVRRLGVDVVQGFLTGRPTSEEAIEALLGTESQRQPPREHGPGAAARPQPAAVDREQPWLPLLPSVLHTICALRDQGPQVDPEDVCRLVADDPVLALSVLQLAVCRSPRTMHAVPSLGEALVLVGASSVVAELTTGSVREVFIPNADGQRLWRHSRQVAHWARAVASIAGLPPGPAFTAGLLHDVGRFAMLESRPDDVASVEQSDWDSPAALVDRERRTLPADHTTIGALQSRARRLPRQLTQIIAHHHDERAPALDSPTRSLLAVVQVADALAVLMERNPRLGEASAVARLARMRLALQGVATPFDIDLSVLSDMWGEVDYASGQRERPSPSARGWWPYKGGVRSDSDGRLPSGGLPMHLIPARTINDQRGHLLPEAARPRPPRR